MNSTPIAATIPAGVPVDTAAAYESTKLLIYKTCHRFAHAYGVQFDDLLSVAHQSFMAACTSKAAWREGKGTKLSTYICWWVTCDLKTYMQKQRRRGITLELNEEIVGEDTTHHSFMDDFTVSLTEDARLVASLVVEAPKELNDMLVETTRSMQTISKRVVRDTVRELLMDRGWSPSRIDSAFNEVSAALA